MLAWIMTLALLLASMGPVHAGDSFGISGVEEWRAVGGYDTPQYIANGCLPLVPPSGLTLSAFSCTGFVRGSQGALEAVIQPAIAFTLPSQGDGAYWLSLYRDIATVPAGWVRSATTTTRGSRYLVQKSVNLPTPPPGGIVFALAIVSGGNITSIGDYRTSLTMATTGYDSPLDQLYGGKGDGVTDDFIPVQLVVTSGRPVNFGNRTWKIGSKLTFTASNTLYRGQNATLLYAPTVTATTTRLADITGSNILIDGLNFDGGALPVKGFLVYLGPNASRVRLHNLRMGNILSHEWGTNAKNFVVALGISPYGVVDFEVINVAFHDIIKYNDGSTLIPPSAALVGIGAAHGIFFMNEDFSEPNAAQVTYTAGVIDGSTFTNIQTVLAAGLSENDRIEFDDGDGIRFYGCNPTSGCVGSPTRLAVKMSNLTFRSVSKRAIKMSAARGQIVNNITVYGDELPYGMVSILKVDNDSIVSNITGWAPPSKPYNVAVQMQGNFNTFVDNVYIEHALTCIEVAAGLSNVAVSNMQFSRVYGQSCTRLGFHMNNLAINPTTQANIRLSDSTFNGNGGVNAIGILSQAALDGTGGLEVSGVTFYNMDLKFLGTNNVLADSTLLVTNSGYAGRTAGSALIEMGDASVVRNVSIDTPGINAAYLNATRDFLLFFGGNGIRVSNLSLKVSEALTTAYPHLAIFGNDSVYDGITYHGPGSLHVGTNALGTAAIRTTLRNVTRLGSTATTTELIYTDRNANADLVFDGIADLRPTTASTVRLNDGQLSHTISNVSSASTNATIVSHGGLAKTTNIQKLGPSTFATLTAQQNGVIMWCSDCTKATPCAGSGTGAFAKRVAGTWDCD